MTWTKHTTHAIYGPVVVTDNTLFYWVDNPTTTDFEIIQYNPATDSRTVIGTESTDFNANTSLSNADDETGIVYFRGGLYIAASDTVSGNQEVWQWGGGTTWTLRLGIADAGFGCIAYNATEMSIIVRDLADGAWHTTDGTTWNQVDIMSNDLSDSTTWAITQTDTTLQLVASIDISQVGTDNRLIRFNGTKWVDTAYSGSIGGVIVYNGPEYYWNFENPPNGYGWTTDPDYTGLAYPSDDDVIPALSFNYGATVGRKLDSPNYQTYTLVNNQWVAWTDLLSFYPYTYYSMANGDVFVSREVTSTSHELWKSSEGFPSLVAKARFYHGAGTLTEKFTLPFTGVAPHAMTLDAALGTVVIGGDAPSGVPIIFSQSPYPTGTATFTAFPTGTAITGLDWI